MDNYETPITNQVKDSDCKIVGNKLLSLLNEKSHHSKWGEFRRMAKQDIATKECSSLLRRMELEVSEEEVEASDTEHMDEDEELSSLQEEGFIQTELNREALIIEDQLINKNQKRKNKWGPTLRFPRPRR